MTYYNYGNTVFQNIDTLETLTFDTSGFKHNENFMSVWPDANGKQRGIALKPIYHSVPKALRENPDQDFYELLAIVDVIRSGRARERNLAVQLLKERLEK